MNATKGWDATKGCFSKQGNVEHRAVNINLRYENHIILVAF